MNNRNATKEEYFVKIADINDKIKKLETRRDKLIESCFSKYNYPNMTMFNFDYIQWQEKLNNKVKDIITKYKI